MNNLQIAFALGFAAVVPAQSPTLSPARAVAADSGAAAINRSDGSLRAYGQRYEAVFGDADVDFQPALGVETEAPCSLRVALESVRRGAGQTLPAAPAFPAVEGLRVRYRRGSFDEIYDVHPEGMEQRFVFNSLPDGTGDLIVRLDLDTRFAAHPVDAWSEDGLAFRLPEVRGEARIGSVTGIDAEGRRCRGSLRCAGGKVLELSLPAAFVDTAALPLVLDPWFTGAFDGSGGGGTFAEDAADVAYSVLTDSYMIVWQREIAGVFQIRARTVRCNGSVLNAFIGVNSSTTSKVDPSIALIHSQDSFVVTWTENLDIRGTAVTSSGSVYDTAGIDIAAGTPFQSGSRVGGQTHVGRTEGIVVWSNLSTQRVEARRVRLLRSTSTIQTVGQAVDITARVQSAQIDRASSPTISKSSEDSGYHLIVWSRAGSDADLRGQIVDYQLGLIDDNVILTVNDLDDVRPACDGDGRRWIVAWEQVEPTRTARDVKAATVALTRANEGVAGSEIAIEADPGDLEHRPAVAWLADAAVVGYLDESSGIDDAFVVRVDPFTAIPHPGREVVESSVRPQRSLAMASRRPLRASVSALVVWTEVVSTGSSTIRARCYDPDTGVLRLGGDCGAEGGRCYAPGAVIGNPRFAVRLRGAGGSYPVTLVLAAGTLDWLCGTCVLVPDPTRGVLLTAGVDPAFHEAAVNLPLPNQPVLRGRRVYVQWVVTTGTGCPILRSDLSDALSIEIH